MATAVKTSPILVTKDELLELANWERKYADAKKKLTDAEKQLKFLRIQLAEKVLGIKTADELKHLAPVQIERLQGKRCADGLWRLAGNAPDFAFIKTNEGRYPAWAQLYAEKVGETVAEGVRARTPVTYSYAVEVVPA